MTHPRLGWVSAPVGAVLANVLGMRVSVASHVDSMAAAELILGLRRFTAPAPRVSTSTRETVGYAGDRRAGAQSPERPGKHRGPAGAVRVVGAVRNSRSTVSDEAVLTAARRLRIPVRRGGRFFDCGALTGGPQQRQRRRRAAAADRTRARVLGESVALLRDILNPDEIVVGGQAFTTFPEGMAEVEKGSPASPYCRSAKYG